MGNKYQHVIDDSVSLLHTIAVQTRSYIVNTFWLLLRNTTASKVQRNLLTSLHMNEWAICNGVAHN